MHKHRYLLFVALFISFSADANERFSGSGALSPISTLQSSDSRFRLEAGLQRAEVKPKSDASGRFTLTEQLAAPQSALGACTPVGLIFANGFE